MYDLIAATAVGLEGLVKQELIELGFEPTVTDNGRVEFRADEYGVARANINLRTCDRLYFKAAVFGAQDFDALYDGVYSYAWEELLPIDAKVVVNARSYASKLFALSSIQSISKKAILNRLRIKYPNDRFSESGHAYDVEIAIRKDIVTVMVNTSGTALHKRGYRKLVAQAPLKETLAAALLKVARWEGEYLVDPFCGSGTIAIEAALMAKNIAPGLNRDFASAHWSSKFEQAYQAEKDAARGRIKPYEGTIIGFDIDKNVLSLAAHHAKAAEVDDVVHFQQGDVRDFKIKRPYGVIVTNPPYAERLDEERAVRALYKDFGAVCRTLDRWKVFVLTSHIEFERIFGRTADKTRRLYNGGLECNYYQYFKLPKSPKTKSDVSDEI